MKTAPFHLRRTQRHRLHGLRIRIGAARKTGGRQRLEIERAPPDREADVVAAGLIESGLRDEEGLLFRAVGALAGKAIDIMMAVALDVSETEQVDQRQILL